MLPEKPWVSSARLPALVNTGFVYTNLLVFSVFSLREFMALLPYELIVNYDFLRKLTNANKPDKNTKAVEGSGTSVGATEDKLILDKNADAGLPGNN